jgi:hypothetical protein
MNNVPSDPTPFFVQLLVAVAPEKSQEVLRYVEDHHVTFAVDESSDRILFQANGRNQRIVVGLRCIARLWASAFAYFRIYTDVAEAKSENPQIRERDLRSSERMREAGDILKWAIETDIAIILAESTGLRLDSPLDALPFALPQPFAYAEYASDPHVADELCLMALGYILHHELAHLRLRHEPTTGVVSILQEKEADRAAADWLLGALDDESNPMFVKRALGIAVGLSWLASLNIYVGTTSRNTHPPAYDRLFQVLSQHVQDGENPVWGMVSLILALHLQNQGVQWGEDIQFDSFNDAANYYVEQIAKMDSSN